MFSTLHPGAGDLTNKRHASVSNEDASDAPNAVITRQIKQCAPTKGFPSRLSATTYETKHGQHLQTTSALANGLCTSRRQAAVITNVPAPECEQDALVPNGGDHDQGCKVADAHNRVYLGRIRRKASRSFGNLSDGVKSTTAGLAGGIRPRDYSPQDAHSGHSSKYSIVNVRMARRCHNRPPPWMLHRVHGWY
jgi:hypothetical protein